MKIISKWATVNYMLMHYVSTLWLLRFCLLLAAVGLSQVHAQTTESLAVATVAPDTPEWLREAVEADDFEEAPDSASIESLPLARAGDGRTTNATPVYSQPAGALTGKVVYTMAGHGWTYDSDKMYYYTQRGLSHGMVEDMGNADQMHIFAHLLFNAGATVIPLRPVDYQPNERVLDNEMPQVEFFGDWKTGSSDQYYGSLDDEVPYVHAKASLEETAVARYRPYIPESGYYPVYVWARDGSDRSNQLYRIAHSGGIAEARVNWRQAGKIWVWLGTYHFEQGSSGYLETTNQVIDPYEAYQDHVVIADAVRFGNGRGDVQRPGGISGYSREDEGDSYWIERGLGVNADRRLFDVGRDGSSTISSPPKAAAYTNRETEGSFLDRVLISFHSNASSGKARGAVALFNASANRRPSYQESFAEILGHELNRQMTEGEAPPSGEKWAPRQRNTYSGINFGELRRDYIHNEMVATIVETAFHDNEADVEFLLDPSSRIQMAQATLRGLFRWYSEVAYPKSAYTLPPSRPIAVAALVNNGKIDVKWKSGTSGEFSGGPATQVRVYRSTNGYGFDGGVISDINAESITLDPLTTAGPTFIRVTALNTSGESFPSQTVAAYAGDPQRRNRNDSNNLLVSPETTLDRTVNIPYKLDDQLGGPFRSGAETQRVRAVYALWEPFGVEEAKALAATGQTFSGVSTTALEDDFAELSSYDRVFYTADLHNPLSPLLSTSLQRKMRDFVSNDGKLFLSGPGILDNIAAQGDAQAAFISSTMGVTDPEPAPVASTLTSQDDRFLPTTFTLTLDTRTSFWLTDAVQPMMFSSDNDRSINLLRYTDVADGKAGAVLTRPTRSEGEVFYLGFPLSLVKNPADRLALMQAILKQM